ncbi:hypothetical protein [Caldalkalibacillus mannanilyticus]|uniref:hypothetical protein n=1 Tax=Caldalkalibacillus mannanilyticus TaxID=1418 RepID=UPI000469E1A1|nr:hypothetical protein [Caldalkalibacillus mannanilyticus]
MDNNHIDAKIKQYVKREQEQLPNSVKERIEQTLTQLPEGTSTFQAKTRFIPLRKSLLFVSIVVLSVFLTGFASTYLWQLYDSKGHIVLELKEFVQGDEPLEDEIFEEIFNELQDQLSPGEAVHVYIHDQQKNPQKIVRTISNPETYTSLEELELKGKGHYLYKIPSYMPEGFGFTEGRIHYTYDNPATTEMIEEAEHMGNDLIIREAKKKEDIAGIDLIYYNPFQEKVSIFIQDGAQWGKAIHRTEWKEQHAQKLTIGNIEALYYNDGTLQEVIWMDEENGKQLLYWIKTDFLQLPKEELVAIASSLTEQQHSPKK